MNGLDERWINDGRMNNRWMALMINWSMTNGWYINNDEYKIDWWI